MRAEKERTRNARRERKNKKCARTNKEREMRARTKQERLNEKRARSKEDTQIKQEQKMRATHLRKMSYWKRVEAVGNGIPFTSRNNKKCARKMFTESTTLISNFFFIIFIDELITALMSKNGGFHIIISCMLIDFIRMLLNDLRGSENKEIEKVTHSMFVTY